MPLVLLRKEPIRLWNSTLPEPGQHSTQLSKLICLTVCRKTKHTLSRWYRTVYIPWLAAFYDTHKGKCWLNSDPPKPQGWQESQDSFTIIACVSFNLMTGVSRLTHYYCMAILQRYDRNVKTLSLLLHVYPWTLWQECQDSHTIIACMSFNPMRGVSWALSLLLHACPPWLW